ncbi:hypothetical protein MKW94_011970 [Papaver nudicaule]|uniref:F-box protein n=1 Tax=Papaver nudicaule TaxID=74823 RepID=A0AA41RTJ5_PAPNU|nr:hypothetical protein [Papaver nudicaule]
MLFILRDGISSLLQNCRELRLLSIIICGEITGIGFLDCPKTLTHVVADRCTLKPEGVKAIVRGGGLEYLSLSTPYRLSEDGEGSINTEAALTISRGCPLLKKLFLKNCGEVELEGWEAISRNCKNLEVLQVYGCRKLCDLGLQALCNGCNKLSRLLLGEENSCSSSALELFKRKKPGVLVLEKDEIDA